MSPLAGPPPNLEGFPVVALNLGATFYRIHRAGNGPWWFSSKGMRFDLPAPRGTCYLAEQEVGAFVEVFQEWVGAILPRLEVEARALSTLRLPETVSLADCTNPRALGFGVTSEIHSTPDRELTKRWALAFADAGYAGIRYFVRHDPSQRHIAVALFGSAGEASWPFDAPQRIGESMLHHVQEVFGLRIV